MDSFAIEIKSKVFFKFNGFCIINFMNITQVFVLTIELIICRYTRTLFFFFLAWFFGTSANHAKNKSFLVGPEGKIYQKLLSCSSPQSINQSMKYLYSTFQDQRLHKALGS